MPINPKVKVKRGGQNTTNFQGTVLHERLYTHQQKDARFGYYAKAELRTITTN